MLTEILRITEENFKDIDPEALIDPKWYGDIYAMVGSISAADTADYARDYCLLFANKLAVVAEKIPKNLQEKYLVLLRVLKLCSVQAMDDAERERFFREDLLYLFNVDLADVQYKIDLLFRGYWNVPEIIEEMRSLFLKGFEKNQQSIGAGNIKIVLNGEERLVRPTLQNWIFDYNTSAHLNPEIKKRTGYERVNYVTTSPNARLLAKGERDLLLKVFEFYDWLRFDPLRYDFRLEGQPAWQEEVIQVNSPQKLIPDDLAAVIESMRQQESKQNSQYVTAQKFELPREIFKAAQAPITPAPPKPTAYRPMNDLAVNTNSQQPTTKPTEANVSPSFKPISLPQQPVSLQEVLKKRETDFQPGLRMTPVAEADASLRGKGGGGAVGQIPNKNATPPNPPFARGGMAEQGKTLDIDRKLDELKKKVEN